MKPILMSTPMVQATLEGRKEKTRRVIKPQPTSGVSWQSVLANNPKDHNWRDAYTNAKIQCPYGQPGDILWVRETFAPCYFEDQLKDGRVGASFLYKANPSDVEIKNLLNDIKWKPSIFMPFAAARLFLQIVSVKVERLHAITEADALKEGVDRWIDERLKSKPVRYAIYFHEPGSDCYYTSCPVDSFEGLWRSINGPESWELNPWVWVVEFKRIDKPTNTN